MKKTVRIFIFCLLSVGCIGGGLLGWKQKAYADASAEFRDRKSICFLVMGMDAVSRNTDVLLLLSLQTEIKEISVLQIPRDTFLRTEDGHAKLNHLYSSLYAQDRTTALQETKLQIQSLFGVPIDYAVLANLEAFERLIDGLGGIELVVPAPMRYSDPEQGLEIDLKEGLQILSGEQAMMFVRFRSDYVEGDLGRIDAQKLLLSALLHRLQEERDPNTWLSLWNLGEGFSSDLPLSHMLYLAKCMLADPDAWHASYMTLPGEAAICETDKLWYYVVNRRAACDLLFNYFYEENCITGFDPERLMTDPRYESFYNIYHAPTIEYRIYTEEDIARLKIHLKS